MKNKKGFTLVELILVIVIIGILTVITTAGVMEALKDNKIKSGASMEKLLEQNMELYVEQNKEDLFCLEDCGEEYESPNYAILSYNDLLSVNPDINLGNCEINGLLINKKGGETAGGDTFEYKAYIACRNNGDVSEEPYYETKIDSDYNTHKTEFK